MEFDRIQCLDKPEPTTRWKADIGSVTIENDSVKFDGKRHLILAHIISVERLSSRYFAHDLVQVDYIDGKAMATVYFAVAYRRGGAEAISQLFRALERLRGSAPSGSIAPEAIKMHRGKLLADQETSHRRGALVMWLGVAVFLIGVIVTLVTYERVASTGGTYVAWPTERFSPAPLWL
jgi:hypothetical protein